MRHNDRTRALVPALAAALTLAACGGGSTADHSATTPAKQSGSPAAVTQRDYRDYYPPGTHKPTPQAVAVITGWSDQLRAGHVQRAASYFSRPVIVQNASPPELLRTRRAVLDFNRTLPCGAHVVKVIAGHRYTVATFVLTERPGSSGCGATGKLAAAAFLLRDGKISEWRRVLVPPPLGPGRNLRQAEPAS